MACGGSIPILEGSEAGCAVAPHAWRRHDFFVKTHRAWPSAIPLLITGTRSQPEMPAAWSRHKPRHALSAQARRWIKRDRGHRLKNVCAYKPSPGALHGARSIGI